MQSKYRISFPVKILRNILTRKFENDPRIVEKLIHNFENIFNSAKDL